MDVIVKWCLALFSFFSLTINIKKLLKHEYITHLRNCFTSRNASRRDAFVVPHRAASCYALIDPKQKIVNYYELKVVSFFFRSYKPSLGGIGKFKRRPLRRKNLPIFLKLKIGYPSWEAHGIPRISHARVNAVSYAFQMTFIGLQSFSHHWHQACVSFSLLLII